MSKKPLDRSAIELSYLSNIFFPSIPVIKYYDDLFQKLFTSSFICIKYEKGELIFKKDEKCNRLAIVLKGILLEESNLVEIKEMECYGET